MESHDSHTDATEDTIGGVTSAEEIVDALEKRGCADLTSSIDSTAFNDYPLARGGFCDVYRGVLDNGTRIAIKSLKVYGSQLNQDSEGQKLLKRAAKELYHWSKVNHRNILPLKGLAVYKGFISIISEWMENGDLPSYLKRNPNADRRRLCVDVCRGVCYIHARGMVHGDLKGANIMISPDGIAMIADFGNARLKELTLKFSNTTSRGISYRWTAPELLLHDDVPQVSMEADVYAYGMTALEALTGEVPFAGMREDQVAILVAFDKKGPSRPGIEMSDALWELLNSCWAQSPSERPKIISVGDRLEALFPLPSIEGVVDALARHGCLDLTRSIDPTTCSERPHAGGSFCGVYQGALYDGTKVAIKLSKVDESSQLEVNSDRHEVVESAAWELYHWSRLKHRNVLPLMGLAVFKGHISIISGWMENGDLTGYLKRNPDADRIKLCMDICAGLCYIHTNRMIHGDLKATNIVVSPNGTAMITNFGKVRLNDLTLKFSNLNTTNHGLSIRWAAPELLLQDGIPQVSTEADVYAYGMTALETLTGEVPFKGISEERISTWVAREKKVPSRPSIEMSDVLWQLLNSCWAQDPSERPTITSVEKRLAALFQLPPVASIIGAFTGHGCSDITWSIDFTTRSDRPHTEGGFCDIYQGTLRDGTRVAIKSSRIYEGSQLEVDGDMHKAVESAARELYHWSRLKHRNVLPLMGLAVFKGYVSIVSGWMENGDLPSYLKRNPDADRIRLCMDICAGLCYIHTNRMIHGDLKGTNIVVSPNGTAMITNFGKVRLNDLTLKFSNTTNHGLSIRWAAPELLLQDGIPQVSMEADVYAYGMTALEALTGEVPSEGASKGQVLSLIANKNKLRSRPGIEISDVLWELLSSCLTQAPSKRPKITDVGNRLEAIFPLPYVESVIDALVRHGCSDLTWLIDLTACSDRPHTGGGFCDVYKGALHDGTRIAIKSLRIYEGSQLGVDGDRHKVLESAARELYHWSRLKHCNVLPLMGLAILQGQISIISGWMENGDLTSYLIHNPDADRVQLCVDVCAGLCYIHASKMVHGDLKAANIMVSPDGIALVADFGNSQLQDFTLKFSNTTNRGLSIRWAAPELLDGSGPPVSTTADVYAYGMTVLEALTGKVPYEGLSETRVVMVVGFEKKLPPRPNVGISDSLWKLLESCWAQVPSERPGIQSIGDRLEVLFSSMKAPSSSSRRDRPTSFPTQWLPASRPTDATTSDVSSPRTSIAVPVINIPSRDSNFDIPMPPRRRSPSIVAPRPENEERALAPLGVQCGLSLAQVVAELAPIPGIEMLIGSLTTVFQAIERAKVNKEQWKLLQGRCVMVTRIAGAQVTNYGQHHYTGLENATQMLEETLNKIAQRAEYYNEMNQIVAIVQFQAISSEIRSLFSDLDACLGLFSYARDVAQSQWVGEFNAVQEKELKEIEHVHRLMASTNTNLDTIGQNQEQLVRMVEVLQQELGTKSSVLQNQSTTTVDNYVDAQQVVRTILAVTNHQLPAELLLGKQCILDANVPIKTGLSCDIYSASFLGGEKVAKKVFRIGPSDQEFVKQYAERFIRIARLWNDFKSYYTLPFYGIGMETFEGDRHFQLYMVSPQMKNFDAVTYLKQYRNNPGMKKGTLRIITDAALGLQYLHNRDPPVVHSGMRGDNILITDSGGGILSGFGLIKALESKGNDKIPPAVMTGKTESQRWMAPEMFSDDLPVLETSSDVWGWAMAALEIVSGLVPYHSHRQALTVMLKVHKGHLPTRQEHIKFEDYAYRPDDMWELLERCWKYDPVERPTMDEVVVRLKEIAKMPEYMKQ